MKYYLLSFLFCICIGCYEKPGLDEDFECTFFRTQEIPEAEDFPAYLACWSPNRVVFLFWHEIEDKFPDLTEQDLDQHQLPTSWFDEETGAFLPSAFWAPVLEIIHLPDGIHDPYVIPELAAFLDQRIQKTR